MKYLLILLLVINLAYWVWAYSNPVNEEQTQLPEIEPNVQTLSLLSERQPENNAEAAKINSEAPENDQLDEQVMVSCYSLGPLTSEKTSSALEKRLSDLGFPTSSRSLEQRETTGYWVFLPPYKTRQEALSAAEELAKKGIKDYYVVTDEEYRHAVSLGLFSGKDRANRRMAHIRTLGYKPQKIVRYRDRTYYWIDYEQNADSPLPDAIWKEMGSAKEKIQKLDRTCN